MPLPAGLLAWARGGSQMWSQYGKLKGVEMFWIWWKSLMRFAGACIWSCNCLKNSVFMDTPHLVSGICLALFGWNHICFQLRIQELNSRSYRACTRKGWRHLRRWPKRAETNLADPTSSPFAPFWLRIVSSAKHSRYVGWFAVAPSYLLISPQRSWWRAWVGSFPIVKCSLP